MKSLLGASLLLMVSSVGCGGGQSKSFDAMSAECLVPMTDPPSRGGEVPGCTCSAVIGRICQDAGTGDASLDGHGDTAGRLTDAIVGGLPDAAPADAAAGVDARPADAAEATLSAAEFPAAAAKAYCATVGPCC